MDEIDYELGRDREEHRDYLEGQASDQLEREEFERDGGFTPGKPLWNVSRDDGWIVVRLAGGAELRLVPDRAVLFANAILSEVEIAQTTPCPICNDQFVVAVAGPDENGQYDTEDCPCQT